VRRPEKSSGGYTLLEILLVLALMVIIASLAAVNLRGGAKQRRLKTAADQIRTMWAQTRNQAIKTGRVQVFHYAPQSRQYFTITQQSLDDPALLAGGSLAMNGQAAPGLGAGGFGAGGFGAGGGGAGAGGRAIGPSSMSSSLEQSIGTPMKRRQLPEDVRFLGAEVRIDQRSSFQLNEAVDPAILANDPFAFSSSAVEEMPQQWGIPIYFYPDGTSSSAELMLVNDRQQVVSVFLRGLTGAARVGMVGGQSSGLGMGMGTTR
jgi:prepilin-type N-terminal cleavage/methylation domain-containing protein